MQKTRMSPKENTPRPAASVVATVHTPGGLRQAARLGRREVGFVELRLDALTKDLAAVDRAIPGIAAPILITARHGLEGGVGRLGAVRRRDLLGRFLLRADALDVELRSAASMAGLLQEARCRGITRVISFHDFRRTPDLARLQAIVRDAIRAGADIVKIATHLRGAKDLSVLLLLQSSVKVPLATMGMGPFGKVSRLVLAAAGSRLNYGYLDKPQVEGQWPALELVRQLEETAP
jgi:3-dehydroquinate dehydratase-1